ncbi:DUF1266 domain-containing protein [Pseudomonas oryziphila]|uniref:DUF1266 domain-containing protein n=1 Tax=Pseudomonas oryziphila TaxID=2894079 RepID=A0ABN5TD37_9PSED|nr:DUF1266 domain-containing protein [Pseudomonas oryziphila]AZL72052.1 DUF1266 domain-containing protein [Pseudomonas oryziphila]
MLIFLGMLVATWLLARWLRPRAPDFELYSPRRHLALALASPMAEAMQVDGFYNKHCTNFTQSAQDFLRIPLLHIAGLQGSASDEEIQRYFATDFERQWFRLDLLNLQPTDDPRASLAFACLRCAFLVRCALLLGWLAPDIGWRVLLLNAQRAQDCFDGWADFGAAYLAGRRQWVGAFRADSLGLFDEQRLQALLAPEGRWAELPWREVPALSPELQPG